MLSRWSRLYLQSFAPTNPHWAHMVCLVSDPRESNPFGQLYTLQCLGNVLGGRQTAYNNQPIETLIKAVRDSIVGGEAVWFGCEVSKRFERKHGLTDLDAHDYRLLFNTDVQVGLSKADRLKYGDSCMTHAMVFTGVGTDVQYEQRYPGCHKVIHYKKVLLEKFSPYSERDGIVKRIKIFDDYALTHPLLTYEYYKNRVDKMETVKIDHLKREVREIFGIGRRDHLLKHVYSIDAPAVSVEGVRILEFNYYPRIDHLTKLVCTPLTFDEFYTNRDDRLESRTITYTEGTKAKPKRHVKDIVETYSRNIEVPAKEDIWKKIFHIQENTIELLYHYAYNFVTNDTRQFVKPNLAETGGKILFYPEKTSGYIADPCAKPPRPLNIYYALCDNMEWEYRTTKHIRDRETDINGYLRQRHKELTEPMLYVALFDTERNEAAKKGWREQEIQKAEVTEREKEAEIDPLAPYLARLFGSGRGTGAPLTVKEATLVREQCINDFKSKQLARQNLVQERFDKLNAEYKVKRLWYLANQFILTPEKESAYFAASAELSFKVHTLEVRLTRHKDLSKPRFKVLEDYLAKHPLLKEYNRVKNYYSKYK
ncbi:hypothetical protein evm_001335 [Chilo suppressalis]|nr:hypothetical protein evm_001335 [Chilo suppressalis]